MANNRYYIINVNDPNKAEILSMSVGEPNKQRLSLDGLQIGIKLFTPDHEQHPQLLQYTEYTHAEILQLMKGENWTGIIFK